MTELDLFFIKIVAKTKFKTDFIDIEENSIEFGNKNSFIQFYIDRISPIEEKDIVSGFKCIFNGDIEENTIRCCERACIEANILNLKLTKKNKDK